MNRGWHSTKLHLALIAMALISAAYALTGFSPDLLDTYCMAILGAAGIHGTSATVEKFAKPKVDSPD